MCFLTLRFFIWSLRSQVGAERAVLRIDLHAYPVWRLHSGGSGLPVNHAPPRASLAAGHQRPTVPHFALTHGTQKDGRCLVARVVRSYTYKGDIISVACQQHPRIHATSRKLYVRA